MIYELMLWRHFITPRRNIISDTIITLHWKDE